MNRAALFACCLWLASCAGRCGSAYADREAPREDDEPIPLDPAEATDAAMLGAARCAERQSIAPAFTLIGNVVAGAHGPLVSVITRAPARLAAFEAISGKVIPFRDASGDTPPPVLASDRERVVAAFFGASTRKEQSFEVVALDGAALLHATRAPDESLALDLALVRGEPQVLWHEDGELSLRRREGRVALAAPGRAVLESPRLFALGEQLLALAIARTWDSADAAPGRGPQTTWEGAGEPRSTSQLVGYVIGVEPSARAFELTPARGHVDAFDAAVNAEALVVFAHDATQTDARGGGSLLRIRWSGRGDPVRSGFRSGDVGTAPIAIAGASMAYGNANGEAVLVRLGADLTELGRASREPLLDDARLLALHDGRSLIASGTELVWLSCPERAP